MHRHSLAAFLFSAISVLLAAPLAIVHAFELGLTLLFEQLAPASAGRPALAFDGPALAWDTDRADLDPALQNSLRHEAGMKPLPG